MTAEEKGPREFWINQSRCTGKAKAYDTLENTWNDTQHNDNIIHVVEYSALKAERAKNQRLREALDLSIEGLEACKDTMYFNPVTNQKEPSVVQSTCRDYIRKVKAKASSALEGETECEPR